MTIDARWRKTRDDRWMDDDSNGSIVARPSCGRRNRAVVGEDDVFSVVETRAVSAFGFGGDQRGTRAGTRRTRGEGGSRARARDAREREKERRDV